MAFSGMMLTTSGKILFAKGQQGKELKYTRFAIGDGINSSDLINRTGLISEKLTVPIDAVQLIDNETTVAIVVTISNETLATGFYFNEMGLFAQDPDTGEEKLYLYDNAGEQGEYIPDKDSGSKVYERYRILTKADNVQNVTFVESGNPIYLTSLDIDDTITSSSSLWSSEKISREISEASNIETLNSIKANTEQVITDVSEIDAKIGNTNDAQSSSTTTGSIFAKLNAGLKHLFDNWTATRATNLDNLDTTVSSRASAVDWTSTRATKIDDIGSVVSTEGARYRAIMERIKKETPVLPDYSNTIRVKGKKLYTVGGKQVRVFDTETFEQIAISPEQEGGCNVFFVDDTYLYYVDATAKKIVKLNNSTLVKVDETTSLSGYPNDACMSIDKLYYSQDVYNYITAFDKSTMEQVSQTSHLSARSRRMCFHNDLIYAALENGKLVVFDGNTLTQKKEATPYSAEYILYPICVYNNFLFCSLAYKKEDGKYYGKIITINTDTLEVTSKESKEFEFSIARYTVKDNLLYFPEPVANSRIFALDMDTIDVTETLPFECYIGSMCLDEDFNVYYSGIDTKKVYCISDGIYEIKGYEKEE